MSSPAEEIQFATSSGFICFIQQKLRCLGGWGGGRGGGGTDGDFSSESTGSLARSWPAQNSSASVTLVGIGSCAKIMIYM